MCDYSLSAVSSRPAKVGDKLESYHFSTGTTGLREQGKLDNDEAVCLRPGTEVAFDQDVIFNNSRKGQNCGRVARFREINVNQPHMHHDAWEFADGSVQLLNFMPHGVKCTVLQLGVEEKLMHPERRPAQAPIPEYTD